MSNDETLVRQAIAGDKEAFARLYDEYFDRIYRYISIRVSGRAEAEDLAQEVFLKALAAIGNFKYRKIPIAAWLFRIAHNEVVDHYRKRSKEELTELDERLADGGDDPVALAEHSLQRGELAMALQKLSPAQREVISLRFGAELSIAEVASTLGKKEGTIKALQYTATIALRKLFTKK